MSTKREFLTELVEENGLDIDEDIFKLPKGGKEIAIITRTGIEKIQYNNDIQVKLEAWTVSKDYACIKATATRDNYNGSIQTFGSAWPGQGGNCMSNYVAEMAEKRALARAVLKISGAYTYGVYAEDESDDFKR